MSTLALGFLIILAVATVTFYLAGDLAVHGSAWARDVCSLSRELCDNPSWGAVATGGTAVIYFILRACRL
jgi:hypothetical protein